MNEQDCLTVYDELVEILNQLQFGWVSQQVLEVISAGKTVEEMVSGRKSPDLKLTYHTPKEQLLLLIDAIEKAVVNAVDIELEIASSFSEEATTSDLQPELKFTSSFEKKSQFIKFPVELATHRKKEAETLLKLLHKLQKEVQKDAN
ncbi:hypothetical protein VB834_12265 [Limnoraphis robusta Tam1]|uniref:Uncharacterized protein n=1 Tax=Limnoraphis robusta CCNP1315 TaxID=3110306 RepID=A0ABU5TWK5_9CYAN|nr:hypothetical protein [Limnoraphis robusta]MEA5519199.1 hypothetical protein [Limnoraphis robusta CCNP1315]MEA5539805.1 hypothetical protein [Limnoraphis robusta Tam1]MEA5543582.1 hypothetical protein [Limnoraphis robusta CCNP1324]